MTRRPNEETKPYPGVRSDAELLAHPTGVGVPAVAAVACGVIDLPLSAALDTLLLPIDLTYRKPGIQNTGRPKEPQQ